MSAAPLIGDGLELVAPVPRDAPPLPARVLAAPCWTYTDGSGAVLFHVARFDQPDGKEVVPYTLWRASDGTLAWCAKAMPTPRALYRLRELGAMPDAHVIVTEGEKAADAAAKLFPECAVTTSSGGCKAAANTDWTPLHGRNVVIWPDNDKPGVGYAQSVERLAIEAGAAAVATVAVPLAWPAAWDLADRMPEGVTLDRLHALLAAAVKAPATREADTQKCSGLVVLTAHEFLRTDFPPRDFVITPILPTQGLAMLYAKRGQGKTWGALTMGYAVACGSPVWCWKANVPRKVLHVCGEMPGAALRDRLASIVAGADAEPPSPDYYRILSADVQDQPLPDLASDEGQELLDAHLCDAEFIVLDNVSTLFRFGKENEAESWGPVQEWLLAKRREGRSVLLVHHAAKNGAQRGTSRREDVLDTVIALRAPEDFDPTQGARFEVHLEKARGIAGNDAEPFEVQLEMRDKVATWSWRPLEDVKAATIAELREGGMSVRQIAKEMGLSRSAVDRMVQKLKGKARA